LLGFSEVFNDSHTIEPDEKFWPRIEKGSRACDAFVVVLSHASVNSYWVDQEVQFARNNGKTVIPIRIDDCKLPASFDGRDVIELRQGHGDRVKIATSRILGHSPAILLGPRCRVGGSAPEPVHACRLGRRRQDGARRPLGYRTAHETRLARLMGGPGGRDRFFAENGF